MNILTGNKRDAETGSGSPHSFPPESCAEFISALFQGLIRPLGRDAETSSE